MAFRFHRKESVLEGFHRVVREETASVVSMLADHGSDLPDRVHEARRGLKRLRALVRLMHFEMESETFGVEDIALRDAGKKLSPARDADVALATFTLLAPKLPASAVAKVRPPLRAGTLRTRKLSQKFLATVASAVRESGHTLAQTSLASEGWPLIEPGLSAAYKAAWKLRRKARKDPTPAAFHEWRRSVKRIGFQVELLRGALDRRGKKLARRLVKLGDFLGSLNDLDVLRASIAKLPPEAACPALDALIENQWARIQKRIFKLSRNTFEMKPAQFTSAMKKAWRNWHRPREN